jgi:hypothetical protein
VLLLAVALAGASGVRTRLGPGSTAHALKCFKAVAKLPSEWHGQWCGLQMGGIRDAAFLPEAGQRAPAFWPARSAKNPSA